MAYPVLQSTGTVNTYDGSGSTRTVTNPSGLTVGDEMVLFVLMWETGSTQTINTPSGWTSKQNTNTNGVNFACFTKTATSGDVSAGSVTVSSTGGSDFMSLSIHRITGAVSPTVVFGSEVDTAATALTSLSYTTALTPTTSESLIIVFFAGARDSGATLTPSLSAYATTPSATYTEVADLGIKNGSLSSAHGVAWANYSGVTEITNRSATLNESMSRRDGSIIVIYSAPQNATGTNALLSVSPTYFSQAGSAGTTGTNNLLEVSPEMFEQSGSGTSPTQWVNEDRPSTTWINDTI